MNRKAVRLDTGARHIPAIALLTASSFKCAEAEAIKKTPSGCRFLQPEGAYFMASPLSGRERGDYSASTRAKIKPKETSASFLTRLPSL